MDRRAVSVTSLISRNEDIFSESFLSKENIYLQSEKKSLEREKTETKDLQCQNIAVSCFLRLLSPQKLTQYTHYLLHCMYVKEQKHRKHIAATAAAFDTSTWLSL